VGTGGVEASGAGHPSLARRPNPTEYLFNQSGGGSGNIFVIFLETQPIRGVKASGAGHPSLARRPNPAEYLLRESKRKVKLKRKQMEGETKANGKVERKQTGGGTKVNGGGTKSNRR
jgi:hypothetical protein